MKLTTSSLLFFGMLQLCHCQLDEIPAIQNLNTVTEETPTGEAAAHGGPGGPVGAQRKLLGGPPVIPPSYQCPLYTGPPKIPKCPAAFSKKCEWKYCWKLHKTGLYYGLRLSMHKSILLRGKRCQKENSPCTKAPRKANCRCKTIFTWFGLRRIVVLDGQFYVVKLNWRRASGCGCYGRRKITFQRIPPRINNRRPNRG